MDFQNVRKNKAITIRPVRIAGVKAHELVEKDVSSRSQAHRGTGVTGICIGRGIDLFGSCR